MASRDRRVEVQGQLCRTGSRIVRLEWDSPQRVAKCRWRGSIGPSPHSSTAGSISFYSSRTFAANPWCSRAASAVWLRETAAGTRVTEGSTVKTKNSPQQGHCGLAAAVTVTGQEVGHRRASRGGRP